jgi:secondary thiamine-phosphate synthase enzyme
MLEVFSDTIEVDLQEGVSMKNISRELDRLVDRSAVSEGTLFATVIGSTGSLTTIEYEPGVVEDLKRAINRMAPPEMEYEHEKAWHDGNGHSHVQAALIGPSLALPVRKGRVLTGTWQQVVVVNHDNRPRNRRIEISIIGRRNNGEPLLDQDPDQ